MADVQVAVRLRREAGLDRLVLSAGQVLAHDLADEIALSWLSAGSRGWRGVLGHESAKRKAERPTVSARGRAARWGVPGGVGMPAPPSGSAGRWRQLSDPAPAPFSPRAYAGALPRGAAACTSCTRPTTCSTPIWSSTRWKTRIPAFVFGEQLLGAWASCRCSVCCGSASPTRRGRRRRPSSRRWTWAGRRRPHFRCRRYGRTLSRASCWELARHPRHRGLQAAPAAPGRGTAGARAAIAAAPATQMNSHPLKDRFAGLQQIASRWAVSGRRAQVLDRAGRVQHLGRPTRHHPEPDL